MEILEFYQNLPNVIDPIIFRVGFFSMRWYSLMYIIAFLVVYYLALWRLKRGELSDFSQDVDEKNGDFLSNKVLDLLTCIFFGIIVGGRLGYVFFYDLQYFLNHPVEIISPISATGEFVGLYGMSFHGGIIGFVSSLMFFAKKNRINFWKIADFLVAIIPAGYFFGRIGNFLNHELYGRVTQVFFGMKFDESGLLRHPSQLYEAFFEGWVLFFVLWKFRNYWKKFPGVLSGMYVCGYGIFRFFLEFFRKPDDQIGMIFHILTMGQILSIGMIFFGILIIFFRVKK
ncbi:MAG: prolipoprotein diacylglyceryl transferase [Candidatus Moranbacteria bacterium]|nr:prolipoprotein diacylglyceryl transferase [Candidatus Moranbacteria bacterium]